MGFFSIDDDDLNFGVMPMGSMGWGDKKKTKSEKPAKEGAQPKESAPVVTEKEYAPGTEIPYDPGLLAHFENQNNALNELLDMLVDAFNNRAVQRLTEGLREFLQVLEQRGLEDSVRFYVYMTKCLKDAGQLEQVKRMKREMGQINRKARQFASHYLAVSWGEEALASFREELDVISAKLKDFLQREADTLYRLYLPPSSY